MRAHFSSASSLRSATCLLAALIIAACAADSTLAPAGSPGPAPLASKQATTSSRILFVRGAGPTLSIFSMDDDGTNLVPMSAAFPGNALFATWAPDGKRILVSAEIADQSGQYAIYVMNQDGTGITALSLPPANCADFFPTTLGKRIIFLRTCPEGTSLTVMNADGTGRTVLDPGVATTRLGPSPKGSEIAYAKSGDIWLLDVATGAQTNLTNTQSAVESEPAFSPSGKHIAFASGGSVFVMNRDGTGVTLIMAEAVSPVWSPDGKRIAFASGLDSGTNLDVFVAKADGTALTNLTPLTAASESPTAWARY